MLTKLISLLYRKYVNKIYIPETTKAMVTIQDGKLNSIRLNSVQPWCEVYLFKGDMTLVRSEVKAIKLI